MFFLTRKQKAAKLVAQADARLLDRLIRAAAHEAYLNGLVFARTAIKDHQPLSFFRHHFLYVNNFNNVLVSQAYDQGFQDGIRTARREALGVPFPALYRTPV